MRAFPVDTSASRRRLLAACLRHPVGLAAALGPVAFSIESAKLFPKPAVAGWIECERFAFPLEVLGPDIQTAADRFAGTWFVARAAAAKAPAIVGAVCLAALVPAFLLDADAFDGRVGLARGILLFLFAAVVLPWTAASLRGAPTIAAIPLSEGALSSLEKLDLLAGGEP